MEKERELRDFQRREDAATDEDVKRVLQYMIEVTVEALKLNFKKEEISGFSKLVLGAGAVEMRWVSMPQAQLINSIWCPLPSPYEEMEEDEDESLFITPTTETKAHGCLSTQRQTSPKRRIQQTAPPVPKRGRITHVFTPSQQ